MALWSRTRRLSMPAGVLATQPGPRLAGEEKKQWRCIQDSVKVLRLTLQNDLPGDRRNQVKQKPVGRAFAMVANRPASSHALASECVKSNDGDEEIIKVYLKARAEDGATHRNGFSPSANDSCHPPELPPDKPNGFQPLRTVSYRSVSVSQDEPMYPAEDISVMRETTKRLFSKLQEAEKRHQSDRAAYETSISHYRREAEQSGIALRKAETELELKDLKLEELQRLLTGMEKEHQILLQKVRDGEAELEALRNLEQDKVAEQERSAKLEKEVATLREKIHHLDDMLKSQQRKVRQMIEQLQNSKTVIQSKDAIIHELKERVAYLEAENLEMHDRMEHLIEKQANPGAFPARSRSKSETVSSKRFAKPVGPKPLPLIRVLET
ncbi:tuftelin isoform X1 [Python bivittatus]|uniref:Tuftelin isoform X1 n=1 Tax=Python bivittatus TaxID=176946 RepID=A0A9F2N908_PYTBI|nr:tuftelin isoform X1 [Python bivittatus]